MIRPLVLIASLLLGLSSNVFAWSAKEHILISRCAVRSLLESPATPADMKAWLRDAQPQLGTTDDEGQFLLKARVGAIPRGIDGIAFWSVMPDLLADQPGAKERKVAPFNAPESNLHFVDLELLNTDPSRRVFAADLSNKPKLDDVPHDLTDPRWEKAGMLPFRIEDCRNRLIEQIRNGRLADKPGQFPRDEHATKWAGMLAHYAADNTMPMHATIDYQAYSFFPEIEKAKRPKVHYDMEFVLVDGDNEDYPVLREELWRLLVDAIARTPRPLISKGVWTTSIEISMTSYNALPLIGHAARAAYLNENGSLKPFDANNFHHFSGRVDGRETTVMAMKAQQLALAVRWFEVLLVSAWDQSR